MKDDAVEWADLIVLLLIRIHERWREFVEGHVARWNGGDNLELVVCPNPRVKSG